MYYKNKNRNNLTTTASSTQRMLIIGPSWVGDMVMAQTLFKLLKQRDPSLRIDVLAPAWTFSLLTRMPEVSQALEMPLTHGEVKIGERYRLGKKLRQAGYDQAIVLPNSFKSALIPWFAQIPKRTGWIGESRYLVINDRRYLDKTRYPLMIEQYMALGLSPNEPLPAVYPYPEFQIAAASQQAVLQKYQLADQDLIQGRRPILALCAGAEFGPSKRWLESHYAEVANKKLAEGWDVWLFGSKKDNPINDQIMQLTSHRCKNLSGRTALAESIDLLSLATGVVSNDSGLMHIAAALRKPVIAVYGSTSPTFTPPLSANATILKLELDCQPCFKRSCPLNHHRCMRDLTPETVLAAIAAWSH